MDTREPVRGELSITSMPELMADIRREVAALIREVAADEEPAVAARLNEVAAAFECGVTSVRHDGDNG